MAKHPRRQRRELDRLRRQQLARRRARAAAAAGGDLALEQLESRQLLAITVTKDTLASYKVGADYVFTDPTSIEISKNLVIDAGGGKISLTAPVITIGDGAQLLSKGTGGAADGAITLTARDASTRTGISPADFLFEVVSGFARDTATITIGAKATLAGGTIQIDAFAGNDRPTFSNEALVAAGAALAGFGPDAPVNWQAIGAGLAGFVGCGLVFAGITDTCGMAMLIARMPWNQAVTGCARSHTISGNNA